MNTPVKPEDWVAASDERCFFAKVKAFDAETGLFDAVASTNEIDRHGEVVEPSAFAGTITGFMANPVILAGHMHRLADGASPVIGSVADLRVEGSRVLMKVRFAEKTKLGAEYRSLYEDGHMRAFSIGFIPRKSELRDHPDFSEDKVRHHTEIELLEISAVAVPANRHALVRAKQLAQMAAAESAAAELGTPLPVTLEAKEMDLEPLVNAVSQAVSQCIETRFEAASQEIAQRVVDEVATLLDAHGAVHASVDAWMDNGAGTGEQGDSDDGPDDDALVGEALNRLASLAAGVAGSPTDVGGS